MFAYKSIVILERAAKAAEASTFLLDQKTREKNQGCELISGIQAISCIEIQTRYAQTVDFITIIKT